MWVLLLEAISREALVRHCLSWEGREAQAVDSPLVLSRDLCIGQGNWEHGF